MDQTVALLKQVCRDVIAPLIRADGGVPYLVEVRSDLLVLHLAGRCSGCPGFSFTIRTLIEPCVRSIDPSVRVVVTHGAALPANATLIEEPIEDPATEHTGLSSPSSNLSAADDPLDDSEYCPGPDTSVDIANTIFDLSQFAEVSDPVPADIDPNHADPAALASDSDTASDAASDGPPIDAPSSGAAASS